MKLYVTNMNFESQITYAEQLKEYKEKLQSMEGAEPTPAEEPIIDIATEGDKDHDMNAPIPQNISSPIPQNISSPIPQSISSPVPLNIPTLQPQEHLSTPN